MIRNMLKVVIIIKSTLNVLKAEGSPVKILENPILRVMAQWTHLYMIDSHLAQREIL